MVWHCIYCRLAWKVKRRKRDNPLAGRESKIKVSKKISEEIFELKASSLKDVEVLESVEDVLSFCLRFFSLNLFQKRLQLINVHCAMFWVFIEHHLHIFWCFCCICPESSTEKEADPETVLTHSLQWYRADTRNLHFVCGVFFFLSFVLLGSVEEWVKKRGRGSFHFNP